MKPIVTTEEVDALLSEPFALVFKHSALCGVSRVALEETEHFLDGRSDVPAFVIDVITHRDVSQYLAEQTGVWHQSPQAIVLIDGQPVWNASHYGISVSTLEKNARTGEDSG